MRKDIAVIFFKIVLVNTLQSKIKVENNKIFVPIMAEGLFIFLILNSPYISMKINGNGNIRK